MWKNIRNTIDEYYPIIAVIIFVLVAAVAMLHLVKRDAERAKEITNTRCPSLLSIGRSPRDTLIVMKMAPDCNQYVMDNLK